MALCAEIRLLIGAFDDGELEPHEMEEIAFHVVNCAECKAILEDYRALGVTLRDAVAQPVLDGFVEAVEARISALPRPLRRRVARYMESLGERLAAALLLGGAVAATAVLTFIMLEPGIARMVANAGRNGTPAAPVGERAAPSPDQIAGNQIAAGNDVDPLVTEAERSATDDSRALVEQLEADSPSVALWSEPRTDTMVIWVPDQQQ